LPEIVTGRAMFRVNEIPMTSFATSIDETGWFQLCYQILHLRRR
jgi:hypothetical protein